MTVSTCNITGILYDPDGSPIVNTTVRFYRQGQPITPLGTGGAVSRMVSTTTDGSGNLDVDLERGAVFLMRLTSSNGQYYEIAITVPDQASADIFEALPGGAVNALKYYYADVSALSTAVAAGFDLPEDAAVVVGGVVYIKRAAETGETPAGWIAASKLAETLTNKTIALGSNTVSGTAAQFSAAVTDALAPYSFATRAALVTYWADGKLPDGTVVSDGTVEYVAQSGATAISDLPGLVPFGDVTPQHFGAGDPADDNTTSLQALLDWARDGYDADVNDWTRAVDFGGKTWRSTAPIYLNNIRQPSLKIGNGGIYGDHTGNAVLEAYGTNELEIIGQLRIEAPEDRTNCPRVGFAHGRCESGGVAAPIAPNLNGRISIAGCFSRAAYLNLGSEVSNLNLSVNQKHPEGFSTFHCGDQQVAVNAFGSEFSSLDVTLPTVADGAFSNILHDIGSAKLQNNALYSGTITNVTQANPAVVSFDMSAALGAKIVNGDTVYITNISSGMTEIEYRAFTIANLAYDSGTETGTLELVGEDATAHTAWAGEGRIWKSTGAVMGGGPFKSLNVGPAGYLLSYGEGPSINFDLTEGDLVDTRLSFQQENNPPVVIEFDPGSAAQVVQRFELDLLSASQTLTTAPLKIKDGTTGTVRIDDLRLVITQGDVVPASGICENGDRLKLRNAHITIPAPGYFDNSTFDEFSGTVEIQNPQEVRQYINKTLYVSKSASGAMRLVDVSNGANSASFRFETDRNTPANSDEIASLPMRGKNSAVEDVDFVEIRGVALDVTDGAEDGSFEIVARANGTERLITAFRGDFSGNNSPMLLLFDNGAGGVVTKRVQQGAADSGGTGFRMLRVTN